MPWRILVVVALLGVVGGGVFGFIRGLSYLPTLPVAVVEGGILFGAPAALLGLVLAGVGSIGDALRRPRGARPARFGWVAAEGVCAAVLLIAVLALPGARYRIQGSATVSLHAVGALAVALGAVAAFGLLVAVLQLRWRAIALDWLAILWGCAALALSVATAAGRIALANTMTNLATGASFTAFGIGSVLGVLGAVG